jgi:ATP-dependent Clp protease, protease subunit
MSSAPPKEVWLTFAGILDLPIARAAFDFFKRAVEDKVQTVHFLIHSPGGNVNDGVCLYNYIRSLPIEVITYNCGHVGSAATTAYLGAKKRVVTSNGVFLIHKTTIGPGLRGGADAIKAAASSLEIDDARTEEIIRTNIRLTPAQLATHAVADLNLTATQAIEAGIAHEIGSFSPNGMMFNI